MSGYRFSIKKCWRCVGQDGDVFFLDSKKKAIKENHWNDPQPVWAVHDSKALSKDEKPGAMVVADCYSINDAYRVRNALEATAK